MRIPAIDSKKSLLAVILIGAVIGALAWPWVGARAAAREISLTVTLRGDGPVALRWSNKAGTNGIWIDLDDPMVKVTRMHDGSRRMTQRQRLPSYVLSRVSLQGEPGAHVEASDITLKSWIFGRRLPTRELRATQDGPNVVVESLPPVWRQLWARGVPASASLGAVVALSLVLMVRVVRFIERWREQWSSSRPRLNETCEGGAALTAVTIGLCIAAPLLMCLWAPMLIIADSTAYVWFAECLRQTGDFDRFDGWRLPGYAVFLWPFITHFYDFAVPVGIAQCGMGIATALLVFDMLRKRLGRPWAHLAAAGVALDPVLLGWQRVVMGESLSALAITLAAWLFLRIVDPAEGGPDEPRGRFTWRGVGTGLLLGLTCGVACVIRGNNQVVPAVLITGMVWCGFVWKQRSGLVAAAPALIATVLVMLPLCFLNAKKYDRFTFTVGRDFTRALFSWDNGTTDWNQSGTLSFEEFRHLREVLRHHSLTDWDVLGWLATTSTVPVPEGSPRWQTMDLRSRVLVDEAVARQGPEVLVRQVQAAAVLLGIPVSKLQYGLNNTWAVFMQLRGEVNPRTTTNFDFSYETFPPEIRDVIARGVHDISWTEGHPIARVYGPWFNSWRWIRAVLGALFLAALARLLATKRWAFAALGFVVLANLVGVPALTYAAEYRYAAPYYPLMAAVIAYGLFVPARSPGRRSDGGTPTV